MASTRQLRVADAIESRTMLLAVLDNRPGSARDIVIFNSGAALYAANRADSIAAGIEQARDAIKSGAARAKLEEFVRFTRSAD